MARSVQDLRLYSEGVISQEPWLHDPRCLPIPWREVTPKSKLKIGVMWHDGIVMPTPPITRALKETVEKLKHAGHEVIQWEPTGHVEGFQLLVWKTD
jgi:amidase